MLEKLIETITSTLHQEFPKPTKKDHYVLNFKDDISVEIFSNSNKEEVTLASRIGHALEESPEKKQILKKLIEFNSARLREHEEVLSWDPQLHALVLFKSITLSDLSEKNALAQMENFLNQVDFWNKAFEEAKNKDNNLF